MLVLASMSRDSRHDNVLIDETKKSTGFMDEFMGLLEKESIKHADGIVLENILNPFLPGYFERRGYTLWDECFNNPRMPSYYKFNPVSQDLNWKAYKLFGNNYLHKIHTESHCASVFKDGDKWDVEIRRKEGNIYSIIETRRLKTLERAKKWAEVTIMEDDYVNQESHALV